MQKLLLFGTRNAAIARDTQWKNKDVSLVQTL